MDTKTTLLDHTKLSDARAFHNKTKIKDISSFRTTPYRSWPESWKKVFYKAYPRFEQIILPLPSRKPHDFTQVLFDRESSREFCSASITLGQCSDLLYYAAGMKRFVTRDTSTKRFYPSAGGRYPLEVYPFVFHIEGIKSGIYHYHVKTHSLELLLGKPFFVQTFRQFSQRWMKKSTMLLVITAIFDRTEEKYKDRGYRHILTEYGHLAQNVYLVATALRLGCCSIGGFIDDGLNRLLDIDGIDEGVVGVITIGKKKEK